MKKPWLAALLNFFFMGPGTIYNGKRALLGIGWTIAAILLTFVEQAAECREACFGIDRSEPGQAAIRAVELACR